ncbi:hypothetical protein NQZ68_008380 [Dissostichus eleginoides]|nr:hypothetical protein NQZ68_008380 [Dissostichus eleginoides]
MRMLQQGLVSPVILLWRSQRCSEECCDAKIREKRKSSWCLRQTLLMISHTAERFTFSTLT